MDEKGTRRPKPSKNRIISCEFGEAIEEAAKQPLQVMATAAGLEIPRLKCITRKGVLVGSDIWPLLKLAAMIEFTGTFFEEF